MQVKVEKRVPDVAEPPILILEVSEDTGVWILTVRYFFTLDYSFALKVFQDSYGFFTDRVLDAWENVQNDILRIITEELEEAKKAAAEIGTFADLVFRFEVNSELLARVVEKITATLKSKYPDLFD